MKNKIYQAVKQYRISKLIFVSYFIAIGLILYFLYFALIGQKGLIKYFSLKEKIEQKEMVKEELIDKMNVKKNMVDGMNTNSLDLDLLDEQARRNLGYAGKNEVVIYKNEDSDKKE